jgi:hypothetical protein
MPAAQVKQASPLAMEKETARAALSVVCMVQPAMAALCRKLWSETLTAIEGKPADVRVPMIRRTSQLYALLIDRAGWGP